MCPYRSRCGIRAKTIRTMPIATLTAIGARHGKLTVVDYGKKTPAGLRHSTPKRAQEARIYREVIRPKFLDENSYCAKCNNTIEPRYRTIHHRYGRTKALLCWTPGFVMLCIGCHTWVESHRNEAVKLGLRAPDNLFNRPSLVIP